ncbi:MAG TPA: hypothetical protein VFI31_30610 [Pirellulales bacterium]|nr:hypothetical protein [Pirellulales bacterium]
MADRSKSVEMNALIRLDLDWQRRREAFLDWGREPRFPTLADVVVTSLFFLFIWGAAICLGHADWILGAAAISISTLFSFRARGFDEAYGLYLHQRSHHSQLWAAG